MSKMDKEHYVDLAVIADFKLVKALTSDEGQILQAVKNSNKVYHLHGTRLSLARTMPCIRTYTHTYITQTVYDESRGP